MRKGGFWNPDAISYGEWPARGNQRSSGFLPQRRPANQVITITSGTQNLRPGLVKKSLFSK